MNSLVGQFVYAIQEKQPGYNDELILGIGDRFKVILVFTDGWAHVQNSALIEGMIPLFYCELR